MRRAFSILAISFLVLMGLYNVGYSQDPTGMQAGGESMVGDGETIVGNFENALTHYEKSFKLKENKQEYYNIAFAKYELGDYEDAIKYCDRCLKAGRLKDEGVDVENVLYLLRGLAKKSSGNEVEANKDFEKGKGAKNDIDDWAKKWPNDPYILLQRIVVYYALGKYKEAVEYADVAIKIKQNGSAYYKWRGEANTALKNYKEAGNDYYRAVGLNPSYAGAWSGLGFAKYKMDKFKEALPNFDKAIKLNKNDFLAYYRRGLAKAKLGKPKEAVADFDSAIKLNDKYAKAYYHRGLAEKELGDEKGSQEDLDKAVELAETEENDDKPSVEAEPTHKK